MSKLDPAEAQRLKSQGLSVRAIARSAGVSVTTARVSLAKAPPKLRARPTGPALSPPYKRQGPYVWDLERIRKARDEQIRGVFDLPVRLAEAMRTDDALFNAYHIRVATQSAITLDWKPADSDAGRLLAARQKRLIRAPQHVRESILGTMANHGLAIGYVEQSAVDTDDGPSVAMTLSEWPLEHVRYRPAENYLETRTADMASVPITHGDGRWIVFRKFGIMPWTQDAAVLPGAIVWAAHAGAISDWAGASYSHGQPKVVGELPEGVRLESDDPTTPSALSPDAQGFLDLITGLVSGDAAAGIRPAGAKTDLLFNGSTAWQVFNELVTNRESAAARIYLGTDAILGSRGGAPGVDVAALFGIAATRIQGDLEALERGMYEGLIEPWCVLHGAPLSDTARLLYEMPDVDADKRAEQEAAAIDRLAASAKAMKDSGLEVTQPVIDALVKTLGVSVPCNLAPTPGPPLPPPAPPTPFTRARRTWADPELPPDTGPIDGDGDGKINEAERKEHAEIKKARKRVEKALAKHEARLRQKAELEKSAAAARAKRAEYSNEDQILEDYHSGKTKLGEHEGLKGKLHDAELARETAEKEHASLVEELDSARQDVADAKAEGKDPEDIEAAESIVAELEPRVVESDKARVAAKNSHIRMNREYAKASREIERAESKLEDFDDGSDAINDELGGYREALASATADAEEHVNDAESRLSALKSDREARPEQIAAAEREHAAAQTKHAQLDAEHDAVDRHISRVMGEYYRPADVERAPDDQIQEGLVHNEPNPAEAKKIARAIVQGPKGGRYYLAPSGEKVYLP